MTIVVLAAASFIPLPYAILGPGPVINTLGNAQDGKPLVTITGREQFPTSGALDFTTVSVRGGPSYPVNVFDLIGAKIDGDQQIVDEATVFPPNSSSEDIKAENAAQMAGSEQNAIAVALRRLGYTVPEKVYIAQVPKGSPAEGKLVAGDQVVEAAGQQVAGSDALRALITRAKPGEPFTLVVDRSGVRKTVTTTPTSIDGRTAIGVLLGVRFTFPFQVAINAGDVGGPSAGMMFALAVYDKLTPGALTGGKTIAGTGSISPGGTVGAIGGIDHKLVGAAASGADYFLAPAGNCSEVVGHVPDNIKRVVKVSTFSDALTAVQAIAAGTADTLPTCG
ncbi:YlbL family protein [Arsenicicoccus piscis]|uniref:endopeptidase La n=1 Tax=Arsenicicoccus piscis TaxID=673954 RepID=A0ABQ6HJ73_9MICO|nr:PDZ domain-containing protein [Arsenicicoccus piscis]GMA18496.1 hypothetical protein GCM10025862_05170 [Arsenicicoccus piscis]